jgi:hypothetical protein
MDASANDTTYVVLSPFGSVAEIAKSVIMVCILSVTLSVLLTGNTGDRGRLVSEVRARRKWRDGLRPVGRESLSAGTVYAV